MLEKMDDLTLHQKMVAQSARFEGQIGVLAWATLEIFRRGGMDEGALKHFQDQVITYFGRCPDRDCDDILQVVEQRLERDRLLQDDGWSL